MELTDNERAVIRAYCEISGNLTERAFDWARETSKETDISERHLIDWLIEDMHTSLVKKFPDFRRDG